MLNPHPIVKDGLVLSYLDLHNYLVFAITHGSTDFHNYREVGRYIKKYEIKLPTGVLAYWLLSIADISKDKQQLIQQDCNFLL